DQPGAAPQRRLGRQRDRAAVTAVAADAEHAAVVALVAVARARPQPAREVVFAQGFQLVRGASHGRDSILAPAVTIPLPTLPDNPGADPAQLAQRIRDLAREAGFQRCGISDIVLDEDEGHLRDWLAQGLYGSMDWMARHGDKRSRPAELIPGTLRVISVGLDYGRRDDQEAWETLADGERAYVARYALGRDYHKLIRQRLQRLAERIAEVVGPFGHRVFVDSAPVLERALARNAGLGWIG